MNKLLLLLLSLSIGDRRILRLLPRILQLTVGSLSLFLFRREASFKIFSCMLLHLSPATGIFNENPVNMCGRLLIDSLT